MRMTLPAMDLGLVVRSHGWYDLPPFEWDPEEKKLGLIFLEGKEPVRIVVRERTTGLVATATAIAPPARVRHVLDRVLNLKANLSPFLSLCAGDPRFAWIARRGAGRILRAPTLFEDAVKVLATTNCTWGLTKIMVKNLIERFDRGGAFPDAAFVAGLPARSLVAVKFGYRAPYLAAFASRVASGKLNLARWEEPARPDEDVEEEIRAEKGFGPYAADTLGRLLGRHRKLGLDSWSRKKVAALRFRGRAVKDARVERLYAPFGPHAGLAFWLDVTRDWHEEKEGLWP
ncbi:MAG: Fe-S cluster assembly protein HesB [Acidobacteriota bacterium]|nr:Fe-S cluster assembly protein HesB [Acidobacteriota bacterium]